MQNPVLLRRLAILCPTCILVLLYLFVFRAADEVDPQNEFLQEEVKIQPEAPKAQIFAPQPNTPQPYTPPVATPPGIDNPYDECSMQFGSRIIPLIVYKPPRVTPPYPTILFLHGAEYSGTDNRKQLTVGLPEAIRQIPDKWPFMVVMPQKPLVKQSWDEFMPSNFLLSLLVALPGEYMHLIDLQRIYLVGLSQGAAGAWSMAAQHPSLFAAVSPMAGWGDPEQLGKALPDVPIWAFHGEDDPVVDPKRSLEIIQAIQKNGGHPKLTLYPAVGHSPWDIAFFHEELAKWLLQHREPSAIELSMESPDGDLRCSPANIDFEAVKKNPR